MRFSVFGRELLVRRERERWVCYYPGNEGKRRLARDLLIPDDATAAEVAGHLADLCHEWASRRYPSVELLEE